MIGLSENGLWLMALAIFGTGIGVSGSQVGLNALTATLYPTQSRATGVSWSKRRRPLRRPSSALSPAA
ncbi:putative 3-hydroxyphenylpropionic transporter MhpT [Raoultella terrigena]|uniref:Putative 3-hydroxyphenylpropionic transporter MhpT n=1 Tax=Raoultella terrigena TaxID=577 RepID=A0A4U9CZZ9_RAOTE|nr:putative 3-hydroxyphenylpropionic transporter MhpT [Raoultella terrigena]